MGRGKCDLPAVARNLSAVDRSLASSNCTYPKEKSINEKYIGLFLRIHRQCKVMVEPQPFLCNNGVVNTVINLIFTRTFSTSYFV